MLIGTSGNVHPAAGMMELARDGGAATVEINPDPSAVAEAADRVILGCATDIVPGWVDEFRSSNDQPNRGDAGQ